MSKIILSNPNLKIPVTYEENIEWFMNTFEVEREEAQLLYAIFERSFGEVLA